jgi:hypothetical protein
MTPKSRALFSALLWVGCVAVFGQHVAGIVRANGVPIAGNDFPAFYCAGKAVVARADPYAVEPLRACEHALPHGSDLPARYVTPAPLPPYALDLFALLAQLPYRVAAWLWFALIAAACAWLALTIARVTRLPSGAVACALLLSAGLGSVVFGQIPPLATLAIALCGAALAVGDDVLAAVLAAAATIEPHVGLPVALALFFFRPATRGWLVASAAGAVELSILAVGLHGTVSYLVTALPAQAHAELVTADQFSLSHVLSLIGIPDRVALLGGTASYLFMLLAGLIAASFASRHIGEAALAYVPAAVVLLGGTFIHEIQLVAALPAAFLLVSRGSPFASWCGRFLVAAIAAVPFVVAGEHSPLVDILALLCATGALVATAPLENVIEFPAALGSFVLAALCVAFPLVAQHVSPPQAFVADPTPAAAPITGDAGDNWGAYLRSDPRYTALHLDEEAAKIPVWLGLASLLVAAFSTGRLREGLKPQRVWASRPRIPVSP